MILEANVLEILERIEAAGYEAYIVGGAVRDYVLGKECMDIDIATSATPEEIKTIFVEVHDTGIKFGTVTVVVQKESYEITTYRTEGQYNDGRRPSEVQYIRSLREDLSRRDLTINAMAYNPKEGIVDYFGGREDIEQGIIRCVGNATERFEEDYLRILRAVRFESQLDFRMAKDTEEGYKKSISGIELVSKERIRKEMESLFAGKGVERVIRERRDILGQIYGSTIPVGVAAKIRGYKVGYLVELSRESTNEEMESLLVELKYPTRDIRWVKLIRENEQRVTEEHNKVEIKKIMRELGIGGYIEVLKYITLKGQETEEQERVLKEIETNQEVTQKSELSITGKEVLGYGYKGKQVGEVLEEILERVIEGELVNKKEQIEAYIARR